jgi:hypothetical protein
MVLKVLALKIHPFRALFSASFSTPFLDPFQNDFLSLPSRPGEPTSARIDSSGALFENLGQISKKGGPKTDPVFISFSQKPCKKYPMCSHFRGLVFALVSWPRHVDFTEFAPCLRNKHGFEGPSPQNFSLWASLFCFRVHKKVICWLFVAFGQKCPIATFWYPLLCLFWPNPAPPRTFLRKGWFVGGPPNRNFRHRVNISECWI